MSRFLRLILWSLMLLTLLPSLALADPPARVGRLAHLENGVNFRVDRSTERAPATLNWPISNGAILDTEWRGRAEVWIGSSAYRVAGNSEVEFVQVDDQRISINVSVGSLSVSIMDRDQLDELSVSTPEGIIRFTTPGRYRIDVLSDHSEVTAQAGQTVVDDRNRPITVAAGQKARIYQDRPARIDGDFDQDNFDFWVAERENATMANAARRYVSPQMTGYQDLDAYGDWQPEAEYGTVWYPRTVATDWAPYRFGRWAWVAPWGWTWIDQAPWGFAPFHYGRWVLIQNRWGWAPGRHAARPVYAPALVGWIGNPGWSVSFSSGLAPAVGWFPLAPREVYVPAYRHSPTYIRQINITHVHDAKVIDRAVRPGAQEHFSYRDRQQAVTVVPANLMREGRPISSREIRRPERQELERAPQGRQAPSADWLAPAAGANRPHQAERREISNGRPQRDSDSPSRLLSSERPAPRLAPATNIPNPPEDRQPVPAANNERRNEIRRVEPPTAEMPSDIRRENGRPERDRRQPQATLPPSPANQTAAPPVRPVESMPPAPAVRPEPPSPRREAPSIAPQSAPIVQPSASMPPNPARENRPERREMQGIERSSPRESAAPVMPQREASPPIPVLRAPGPPTPAAPQPMREERRPPPSMPGLEQQPRREMREAPRETPRLERSMPREIASPAIRQREVAPPAAPAMRSPQPQPQPAAPQPQAAPQPMREMPRQEPRQEPRGGERDKGHQRQERSNEKGERGPR